MLKKSLMLLAPMMFASACTPVDYGFGESVRANIEQQVVDPDPQYVGEIMEGGSGQRGVAAVRRYNTGQVKPPAAATTTGGVGGSSSPSGSTSPTSTGGPQ